MTRSSTPVDGAEPRTDCSPRRFSGRTRLAGATSLALMGGLLVPGTSSAAVTVGSNISVFPNRDMVVAVGYEEGEQLLIEVLRNDVVIGTTQGPAVETPEGIGIEVNHGPLGAPQPGDCWTNYTPDIIGGDVIRVTAVGREGTPADTMTVEDVAFSGAPVLEDDGSVSVSGTATPGTDFAVEFRRDKPTPRFRRGPFVPVFEAGTHNWKATFRPTATSAEGLSAAQQRDIALNAASWLAVADNITATTLAELGEGGGVGPGCTGSADPNTLVGGLEPINIASGDVTFSGTARASVTAVSVTVGALEARDATVTAGPAGADGTWTLTVPKADLAGLPDGNVSVTPRFGTLTGASRTVLKDTVAPLAPNPSIAPGTYGAPQSVALNKPAGEGTSKVYWEIGNSAVPDPDAFSNLYTGQISVTSTQTLKGRLIDAAGNPGAVGTFDYKIGTPPAAPTGLTATESTTTASAASLRWNAAAGATGYNVYRNDLKVNATPLTVTSFTDAAAGLGDHSYVVRAVEANGIESLDSDVALVTIAAPDVPAGLAATQGDARVTLNWTAATGVANYRIYRDGVALPALVAGSARSYTNTGLTNGTLYEYAIAALDAGGNESTRTGIVQAVPQVPADTTPPPAPTVTPVSGTYASTQSVTMADAEAGAVIRYTVGTGTTVPADPTATSPQYTAAVAVSSSQVIRAAAFDAAGNSSTVTQRNYTISTTTVPAAPAVTVTGGNTSATLNWTTPTNASTSNITSYRVRRYLGTSATAQVITNNIAATARSLAVTGLTNGTSYSFDVTAFSGTVRGDISSRVFVTPAAPATTATAPGAPTIGTAASGAAGGTITATAKWSPPTSNGGSAITGYRVEATRNVAGSTPVVQNATGGGTATSFQMTLPAGTYRFRVRAVNAVGNGLWSASSNAVTAQ